MKTTLASLLILFSNLAFNQESIDLANVYWRTSPLNSVADSVGQRHLNTGAIDVKLPVVLNPKNVVIFGGDYQQTNIAATNARLMDVSFSSCALQVGWEHRFNERSKLLMMSITRLNSNFKQISINHFQQGGLVLGSFQKSNRLKWKYGAYYNQEFFGPMIVPLLGFDWKMNKKWQLKMMIPLSFELSHHSKKGWVNGLKFEGVNGSFRANQIPLKNNSYIDKADNNIWLFSERKIGKNIWLHLKAGHSILRKYRIYNAAEKVNWKLGPVNFGDDRPKVYSRLENGFSFELRLIYRLMLNK